MPEAVIVAACRTAIGTSFKGTLAATPALDLADAVLNEVVSRAGFDPELVDDVILGEVNQGGGNIARHAAVRTGMVNAPGLSHNRQCASSLSTVATAAATIRAGMDRAVVAGGVESLSTAPKMRPWNAADGDTARWLPPSHPSTPEAPNDDMTITVGWNAAQRAGISRDDMDRWALRSHERAIAAIDERRFVGEIVPIKVTAPDGSVTVFEVDEHPRRGTTLEKLAGLKVLHPEIPGFSITAGNSSGLNDAGSALMVTSDAFATEQQLNPLARIVAWASVGVDPVETGLAPIKVIEKVLARAGLGIDDIAIWEINEAFASVPIAASNKLGIDPEIINVSGSGCSLGHPIGASGGRMVTTLLTDLRRTGGRYGVAAMCAGGGMAGAVLVELL